MNVARAVGVVVASFAAMEVVSYAAHRWVMHGFGMAWHGSHHRPPTGTFERNDLFPLCFSAVGFGLFLAAAVLPGSGWLWWVGVGVTLYGLVYLVVHDIVIHHRLGRWEHSVRFLAWLRESHRIHHRFGGEPYGMVVPVVPRELRARMAASPDAGDDRGGADRRARSRASTRATRMRL